MQQQVWTFDVETPMLKENESVQRIVCFSYSNGQTTNLVARDYGAYDVIKWLLQNDDILLVNQFINFDLGCVFHTWPDLFPLIIEKFDKLLIDCTMFREKLYAIARGYYKQKYKIKGYFGLQQIVDRRFSIQIEKGGVQLQYHLVDNLPIEKYPKEYVDYSLLDAKLAYDTYFDQNQSMLQHFQINEVPDSRQQTRAYFGLFLMGKLIGIRTDPKAITKVEQGFQTEKVTYEPALKQWGLMRENGTINKKRLQQVVEFAYREQGKDPPLTDPTKSFPQGQVSTSKEILTDIDYPILILKRKHKHCDWYLNNYVKMLKTGIDQPIFVYYNLVDSGRTSASPNVQNQSRKYGIRECYIPSRDGWVLLSVDYGAIEMVTFAQVMYWIIGPNRLMQALNDGIDPHVELGRNFPQISLPYNQAITIKKDKNHPMYEAIYGVSGCRFVSKIGNFGYAGGMGANTFIDYAKKNSDGDLILTLEESQMIKQTWLNTWPEAKNYFRVIGQITDSEHSIIEQFVSKRLRGHVSFTQCSNTFFQGLAADGAKNALWLITKACFYDRKSPLFGFVPNAFIHDEFLLSGPEDRAPEACEELNRLMIQGMQPYVPDLKIKTSMAISDRWYKSPDEKRDSNGRLMVYRGE